MVQGAVLKWNVFWLCLKGTVHLFKIDSYWKSQAIHSQVSWDLSVRDLRGSMCNGAPY